MFRLLILSCFIGIIFARPDVSLGYRYPNPSGNGYNYQNGNSPLEHFGAAASLNSQKLSPPLKESGINGEFVSRGSANLQIGGHLNGLGSNGLNYHHPIEDALVTKQFYIHTVPEDVNALKKHKHFRLGRTQKNYRVIFIRAPSSNKASLSAEYAPSEEKTVIYVLSQKEHELNIGDIATPAPTQPSKPEVYFIKYKTPEEAFHAQQQIQAQYDSLGGLSQVSDEGLVPVSSVEGSVPIGDDRIGAGSILEPTLSGGKNYLPPNKN